ncbi:hypothetical protein N656DRAFT_539713 [Canariomyces notabilis]|uniref:Uncharacterized protein n=1 Tax=Canariomyces notabilis TaxID=2074819 RepID=A0AAN6THR2_9PEZI|nr:hypothetical protein N656DRAFT_539713 [Canariomyces arenarius]
MIISNTITKPQITSDILNGNQHQDCNAHLLNLVIFHLQHVPDSQPVLLKTYSLTINQQHQQQSKQQTGHVPPHPNAILMRPPSSRRIPPLPASPTSRTPRHLYQYHLLPGTTGKRPIARPRNQVPAMPRGLALQHSSPVEGRMGGAGGLGAGDTERLQAADRPLRARRPAKGACGGAWRA